MAKQKFEGFSSGGQLTPQYLELFIKVLLGMGPWVETQKGKTEWTLKVFEIQGSRPVQKITVYTTYKVKADNFQVQPVFDALNEYIRTHRAKGVKKAS